MPSPGFELRSPSPKAAVLPTELTLQDIVAVIIVIVYANTQTYGGFTFYLLSILLE